MLTDEQFEAYKASLGEDEGATEAFDAFKAAIDADKTALDTATGEATKATRATAAADKKLAQALADLETAKGEESEQLAAMIVERDAKVAESEALTASHRAYKMKVKLGVAMGITDAGKLADALALFALPEGADINDEGELTGCDKALEAFKVAKPYLFETESTSAGNGGGRKGQEPAANRGTKTEDTREGRISKWTSFLYPTSKKSTS